ncbi:uncharacterized protein LOC118411997 [Branchiostoma floridae]|uniref:Uncharacterized protein LOC118411997 n=1 Tax=Branchiostoma floridae TaxID=7739 RepID=A0A9J7KU89_BRAFL|nr:uncharacterized protein LOC118411997 [Branchiostoma floridae]XP_035670443.1 uncharacterized protein LOC118411997 [Branchiostoma floridae]
MKTRSRQGSAVQAVLTIATRGRITFSPPVKKEEQPLQPPPQAAQPPASEDAGSIGQRLRKKRNDKAEIPAEVNMEDAQKVNNTKATSKREQQPAVQKVDSTKTVSGREVQPGMQKEEGGKGGMKTSGNRKRKVEDEDWEDSGMETDDSVSGWEDTSGVVGTMPTLRQVRFPPPPPGESEEDKKKREEMEEAERKKAWAEWQFAAATERNRIRAEHDRKAVQRELMHRRWLKSLSKKERKKYERTAKNKESLRAMRDERSLLELQSDLVSALQVGHIDVPAAVSVLKKMRDIVFTQRLLTNQPTIVYTLHKVREFAGSRQVQKLAHRLYLSCRIPFMVYEGESFIQAFERGRQDLLERDARNLEEELARKAERAIRKMKEAEDQVVPGEEKLPLPNPAETWDTEAVVPGQ